MENKTMTSARLVADSYERYHRPVFRYICSRINDCEEAKDLSQDVFVRLMEYKQMLCPDTVCSFIYTIARNLMTDYLRRYYKKQEITSYIYDASRNSVDEPENRIVADDLSRHERLRISRMPSQRRKIYIMHRFGEQSSEEISQKLNLSRRTVENHLFIGRKEVREYIRQCI